MKKSEAEKNDLIKALVANQYFDLCEDITSAIGILVNTQLDPDFNPDVCTEHEQYERFKLCDQIYDQAMMYIAILALRRTERSALLNCEVEEIIPERFTL